MDNNILQYISPEVLQQQNAEFLKAYPTDDAQIDYYTDLAMKLWEEFQIDGSYDVVGTRINVATWYENKRAQMEMFRKHPYWCEEAKAILFSFKDTRKVDLVSAYCLVQNMRYYIYDNIGCDCNGNLVLYAIENALCDAAGISDARVPVITERLGEQIDYRIGRLGAHLPKGASRMLRVGTKISRFIRKCCEEYELDDGAILNAMEIEDVHAPGDRNFDSVEKRFAKVADALSELTTTKIGLLSLNFLDFMTMSNGNSWSTCHYINSHGLFHQGDGSSSYHGAYKQGCLSYALDEPSFIFYTLPGDTKETDYYRQQKLTRMCCQYANGALVTGKCYPNNATDLITKYVNMLQNIISVIETNVDEWDFSDSVYDIQDKISTSANAAHYADYTMSHQHPTISLCRKLLRPEQKQMTIGHKAYCVYCGKGLNRGDGNWLQCSPHRKKMVCAHCGKKLNDDMTYHEYGELLLCDECAFYCAVHNRVETIDNLYGTVMMKDGEVKVCNSGMELLAQCENCGVYGLKDKMLRTERGYSCKKHVRRYKKCNLCGCYVYNKEVHTTDSGGQYCSSCHGEVQQFNGIDIVTKEKYDIGDYIVVANEESVRRCTWGTSGAMRNNYPGKIVKITHVFGEHRLPTSVEYVWTKLDNVRQNWWWDVNCIECAIIGVDDRFIGKTLEEARQIIEGV